MSDAQQEFDQQNAGAPQAPDEVTQDVAHDEAGQIAEEEHPETIPYDDFRAYQSKMDKRLAEKEKRLAELEKLTTPTEPTPDENRRYQQLLSQYEEMERIKNAPGISNDEKMQALFNQGAIARDLMEAESVIVAREVGINPHDPKYREAIMTGEVRDRRDLERIAWQLRATGAITAAPQTPQKKGKKGEDDFRAAVEEEVKRQIAELRQQLGLNSVPGVGPTGKPDEKTQLQRQYEEAKKNKNWDEILFLKRRLASM